MTHSKATKAAGDRPTSRPMAFWLRTLRLADGPDEVHGESIAKMELKPYLQG